MAISARKLLCNTFACLPTLLQTALAVRTLLLREKLEDHESGWVETVYGNWYILGT